MDAFSNQRNEEEEERRVGEGGGLAEAVRETKYMAFGGSGTCGMAYLGCLKALQAHCPEYEEWHREKLKGTVGSSSGCLAALAFLVNADADALVDLVRSLQVDAMVPFVDLNAMFARYGVDPGDEVRRVLRAVFGACGLAAETTTFRALHRLTGRDLRVCATNLNRARPEVFSHSSTPDVLVADAMYWSMTVPFVFEPGTYEGDLMVDGCVLTYVPHSMWPIGETLVFHASGMGEGGGGATRREVGDLRAYASAVVAACARSMLREVDEAAARRPDRFVRMDARSHNPRGFLALGSEALEALVGHGFATVASRLRPDLAPAFARLLRLHLALRHSSASTSALPPLPPPAPSSSSNHAKGGGGGGGWCASSPSSSSSSPPHPTLPPIQERTGARNDAGSDAE